MRSRESHEAFYERLDREDRAKRWLATAATWAEKAAAAVQYGGYGRGMDYWINNYVWKALEALDELLRNRPIPEPLPFDDVFAGVIPDGWDDYRHGQALKAAEGIVASLRARADAAARAETISKLENVEGRTPEEAAAFLAKATDLRKGRA